MIPKLSKVLLLISLTLIVFEQVQGHGRVLEPVMRSSIWRLPEYFDRHAPVNYDDNALYCGGYAHHYQVNKGKCGVCGDPWDQATPRDNEDGGKFYKGIIVRGYKAGQVMPIEVELTATHYGYLEFRLCAKNDPASHSDQTCYDEHVLQRPNSVDGSKYYIKSQYGTHYASYNLTLPKDVTCSHCVLQWHYQTGNRWGVCEKGHGALGCGDQEVFRGCSDIIIVP